MPPPQAKGAAPPSLVTEGRMVGNQFVFRVKDPRPRPTRAPKTLAQDGQVNSRKSHRKSRTGCGNCKKRRVKCDETKPCCRKCDAYGVTCDYTTTARHSSYQSSCEGVAAIESTVHSLSISDLVVRINDALQMGGNTGTVAPLNVNSNAIVALRQFFHFTHDFGRIPDSHRRIMRGSIMRLALQTPYLMHAILGVATTSVSGACNTNGRSYKTAEAYHWQHAIRGYQEALMAPVGKKNMDQLMSTCILVGILSFSDQYYDPYESWVFSSNPRDLNWLLVQGGLKYLLQFTWPFLRESIWQEVFSESDDDRLFDNYPGGVEHLHQGLREFCCIDETSTEENNPFYWVIRMLTPLLDLEMGGFGFTKLCGFMGRLEAPFTDYLIAKDTRALLILGHWLGKMCEDEISWAYPRCHAECTAICMYLENHEDPRVLKLLEYPAEKCGYLLRHVREEAVFVNCLDTLDVSNIPAMLEYPIAIPPEKCPYEYGDALGQEADFFSGMV